MQGKPSSKRASAIAELKQIHWAINAYVGSQQSNNPVKVWLCEISNRLYSIIVALESDE